jgi:DNA-directed RNA polymerase alpha subunit
MSQPNEIRTYFMANAPPENRSRAINAVKRSRVTTMEELCAMSEEQLRRCRNLGDKSYELVKAMCEKYKAEKTGRKTG